MGIDPFVMMSLMPFIMVTVLVGSMIVIIMVMGTVTILSRVVEQRHPLNLSQGQSMGMIGQRLGHKTFQLGANPHHQPSTVDAANIGRAQGKIVWRGTGRQQYLGLAHPVSDRRGNEAKGLDGGQYLNSTNRQTHRQQGSEKRNNSHW